jgi:parallel beta-helix repeat protein
MGRRRHRLIALAIATAGALAAVPGPAGAATTCDRVASPTGSDSAAGTVAAPYRTTQKLVDSLSAGQTGCLRAGTYSFTSVKLTHGGIPVAPIKVTSYPNERAKLVGRLWVDVGANDVTFSNLDLDGTNPDGLPSPLVLGDDVTFTDDDVTNNHTGICFNVGAEGWEWAVAQRTVITRNRIHHCGRLPSTNHDHGIYLENTTDAHVTYNLIYQNADRGIQLYPNAQRTTISHNVIDRDGEGILFSGADGYASSDTVVTANIITNAVLRADVEAYWPSGNPVGHDNQVTNNCVFGGRSTIDTSAGGFTATANTFQDPQYVDGANGDYHLRSASPCLAVAGDTAAVLDGPGPPDTLPPSITSILPADGAGTR